VVVPPSPPLTAEALNEAFRCAREEERRAQEKTDKLLAAIQRTLEQVSAKLDLPKK
jgi:hypothetical protein